MEDRPIYEIMERDGAFVVLCDGWPLLGPKGKHPRRFKTLEAADEAMELDRFLTDPYA